MKTKISHKIRKSLLILILVAPNFLLSQSPSVHVSTNKTNSVSISDTRRNYYLKVADNNRHSGKNKKNLLITQSFCDNLISDPDFEVLDTTMANYNSLYPFSVGSVPGWMTVWGSPQLSGSYNFHGSHHARFWSRWNGNVCEGEAIGAKLYHSLHSGEKYEIKFHCRQDGEPMGILCVVFADTNNPAIQPPVLAGIGYSPVKSSIPNAQNIHIPGHYLPAVPTSYYFYKSIFTASSAYNCVIFYVYQDSTFSVNPSFLNIDSISLKPVARVSVLPNDTICTGYTATLTASGAGTGGTFLWSNAAASQSIQVTPSLITTYTVTINDADGCSSSARAKIFVGNPIAHAGSDVTICTGGSAILHATGGVSYLWSTGGTTHNIIVNPTINTIYTVTVSNPGGCSATDNVTVFVDPNHSINASAGADTTICSGSSATLHASGGGTYLWSNGSTSATITVQPTSTKTYIVTVTGTNGCVAVDAVVVHLKKITIGTTFDWQVPLCKNDPLHLCRDIIEWPTGGTAPYTYLWNDGQTSQTIHVCPTITTTYNVTITDNDECSETNSITVYVSMPYAIINNSIDTICSGGSVQLGASGGVSYLWSLSTGLSNAYISNPVASPTVTTIYTVMVTDSIGCIASNQITVVVLPQLIPMNNLSICSGQSATLTASGGGAYLWCTGDTIATITVFPSVTTTYTVTVSINNCSASENVQVKVTPMPLANAGPDVIICKGNSTTLIASGGMSYLWLNGDTTSSITVSPRTTTIYTVTVSNGGTCTSTDDVTVFVHPLPKAVLWADKYSGCAPLSVNLISDSLKTGMTSLWDFGDGSTSGDDSSVHIFNSPGIYIIKLMVTDSLGCTSIAVTTEINVFALPIINFLYDTMTAIVGNYTEFTPVTSDASLELNWDFGGKYPLVYKIDGFQILHIYSATGDFNVLMWTKNQNGCADTVRHVVHIRDKTYDFIPNAFTPALSINNCFAPISNYNFKEYHLTIFDRWGNKVFETFDQAICWDGRLKNGSIAAKDTYVWMLRAKNENEPEIDQEGPISLIR